MQKQFWIQAILSSKKYYYAVYLKLCSESSFFYCIFVGILLKVTHQLLDPM